MSNPKTIKKDQALKLLENAMHLLNEIQSRADEDLTEDEMGRFWGLVKEIPQDMRESVIN